MNPDEKVLNQIIDYLHKNQKITAIAYLKEQTGCGLKEAKDFVDEVERKIKNS